MHKLRDIKKAATFIEYDAGTVCKYYALEDARRIEEPKRDGHELRARLMSGTAPRADKDSVVTFFEALNPSGYGLNLEVCEVVIFIDDEDFGEGMLANSKESAREWFEAFLENLEDGYAITVNFKRQDMTAAELAALPEI